MMIESKLGYNGVGGGSLSLRLGSPKVSYAVQISICKFPRILSEIIRPDLPWLSWPSCIILLDQV
jgi:hypothetical protein